MAKVAWHRARHGIMLRCFARPRTKKPATLSRLQSKRTVSHPATKTTGILRYSVPRPVHAGQARRYRQTRAEDCGSRLHRALHGPASALRGAGAGRFSGPPEVSERWRRRTVQCPGSPGGFRPATGLAAPVHYAHTGQVKSRVRRPRPRVCSACNSRWWAHLNSIHLRDFAR